MSFDTATRARFGEGPGDSRDVFPTTAWILPWPDPVLDQRGHDPRSRYVEQFWLGVIGPTGTWLLRRIVARFDDEPDGFEVVCADLAGELGLSVTKGFASPFARALHRCVMFQAARPLGGGTPGWQVRRRLPTVAQRHLRRLPQRIQEHHSGWDHAIGDDQIDRARLLAEAMVGVGDDPDLVERQLLAVGVPPAAASQACEHVLRAS